MAIQKFAAVRKGTDDFADGDCWFFNTEAQAEAHSVVRAATGVECEVKPVPRIFVNVRIQSAMARVPPENVARLMLQNAAQLRGMDAKELKRRKLTPDSVSTAIAEYEMVARAYGVAA